MVEKILYTKPSITELEIKYASDAAINGWGSRCYEYIEKFEESFSNHIGSKYAIATSSCTGAFHMGLHALGINEGDEVILADTNWIATISPIIHLGAKPILVDIDKETWCIDPEEVEKNISPKTKAIIATHLYGNLCNMDELLRIGEKYNIHIIEDAAEAIGAIYKSKRAGSIGKFSTFSFHGTKTITTGEGGIFLTDDKDLFEKVLTLSNHGRSRNSSIQFYPEEYGFKYKMSNLQAAIGFAQVERIDELIARKRYILDFYKSYIDNIDGILINVEQKNTSNGCWMPNIVFNKSLKINREKAFKVFQENDIDARLFFWPLSSLPMSKKELSHLNKNSYDIASRSINLPSYHDMTEDQMHKVIETIKMLIKEKK